ncbi:MAG: DMT family protein [Bacteroidales bacterium]
MLKSVSTIGLLIVSNFFMTLAWYGHLRLQQMKITEGWPLIAIILLSWGIAFFEYSVMVPANRIGFNGNGGPFSLIQLKVIQEAVSITVFMIVATLLFRGEAFQWNHGVAFVCIIAAVYFAFLD